MAFVQLYPILLSLLFALFSLSVLAQTTSNITLGTSLTTGEDDSFRASPSGEFAFGFKQIEEDGFLLATWFNSIPEETIVWSPMVKILHQRVLKLSSPQKVGCNLLILMVSKFGMQALQELE
ncbi:hypothetical protein K1719_000094 [Acacia pycnantha]|nr:hypothetical protein K1719_000094 [Acacia pycnantha]